MKFLMSFLILIISSQSLAKKIKVAVIDSGIYDINESNVNYKDGYNYVNSSNKFPLVNINHGSFIMKIIAKNKKVEVIPYQIGILTGKETREQKEKHFENYTKALKDAILNKKVDIINISLASSDGRGLEEVYLEMASERGIKVFVAAGNEGISIDKNPRYPCSYSIKNLTCISSLSKNERRDMNYGKAVKKYIKSRTFLKLNKKRIGMEGSSISTAIYTYKYSMEITKNRKLP